MSGPLHQLVEHLRPVSQKGDTRLDLVADIRRIGVHLDDGLVARHEPRKGIVGPGEQYQVRKLRCFEGAFIPEPSPRPHVIRPILRNDAGRGSGRDDRHMETLREAHDRLALAAHPLPYPEHRPLRLGDCLGRHVQRMPVQRIAHTCPRNHGGVRLHVFNRCAGEVFGKYHHGHAAPCVCRLDGILDHCGDLLGSGDLPVVDRHVSEDRHLAEFLEEMRVLELRRHLPDQRKHRNVVHLGVVEPIEHMHRSRTRRGERHTDRAIELRIGGSSQGTGLFVTNLDVPDGFTFLPQPFHHVVDRIRRDAIDMVDPQRSSTFARACPAVMVAVVLYPSRPPHTAADHVATPAGQSICDDDARQRCQDCTAAGLPARLLVGGDADRKVPTTPCFESIEYGRQFLARLRETIHGPGRPGIDDRALHDSLLLELLEPFRQRGIVELVGIARYLGERSASLGYGLDHQAAPLAADDVHGSKETITSDCRRSAVRDRRLAVRDRRRSMCHDCPLVPYPSCGPSCGPHHLTTKTRVPIIII